MRFIMQGDIKHPWKVQNSTPIFSSAFKHPKVYLYTLVYWNTMHGVFNHTWLLTWSSWGSHGWEDGELAVGTWGSKGPSLSMLPLIRQRKHTIIWGIEWNGWRTITCKSYLLTLHHSLLFLRTEKRKPIAQLLILQTHKTEIITCITLLYNTLHINIDGRL